MLREARSIAEVLRKYYGIIGQLMIDQVPKSIDYTYKLLLSKHLTTEHLTTEHLSI